MNRNTSLAVSWIAQIGAIVILGQSLYFKFTGHTESVAIFTDIGMEPKGRILIGVIELVACLLMLRNASAHYGALLGACVMGGAVVGHFTQIGWEGGRGQLGLMAVLVFVFCSIVLYIRRADLPLIKSALEESKQSNARFDD